MCIYRFQDKGSCLIVNYVIKLISHATFTILVGYDILGIMWKMWDCKGDNDVKWYFGFWYTWHAMIMNSLSVVDIGLDNMCGCG